MERLRYRIEIEGTVQGIGFRPFIYRLAVESGLDGYVLNNSRGVIVEAEGRKDILDHFLRRIREEAPSAARLESLRHHRLKPLGYSEFVIRKSEGRTEEASLPIPPDLSPCPDCLREMWDPLDRRYFYPFINCTNCGPRFTIIRELPYDRAGTVMNSFVMCAECRREYENPLNRRFHAQPNACPDCGPRLFLGAAQNGESYEGADDPNRARAVIRKAASLLADGAILAVKGVGGFHLTCDATNEEAVRRLRSRKNREEKPLAVMFPEADLIRKHALLDDEELTEIRSPATPILLLRRLPEGAEPPGIVPLAPAIAPNNRYLGAMLPSSPLHHLLLKTHNGPLVMTSGNRSEEPICQENEEARERLGDIADYLLLHDRDIYLRCDDSVIRREGSSRTVYRLGRGNAPQSFRLKEALASSFLALGAEMKNAIALGRGREIVIGQHIGDLKNPQALKSFEQSIGHYRTTFDFPTEYVVCDLHPDYLNTRWALENFDGNKIIRVQHHHAHLVACMGEYDFTEPVLGIVLDGSGYGTDGVTWGGEILLADRRDFRRLATLRTVPLAGGEQAIREPWRLAVAYLLDSLSDPREIYELPALKKIEAQKIRFIAEMIRNGRNSPRSSGCGRVFDGVAALLGIRSVNTYDAQAAIELEQLLATLDPDEAAPERYDRGEGYEILPRLRDDGILELDWRPLFRDMVRDIHSGRGAPWISLKFHRGMIRSLAEVVRNLMKRTGIMSVALSGGCFLNRTLTEGLTGALLESESVVLRHRRFSPGDGSISFGQLLVADAITGGKESCVWRFP